MPRFQKTADINLGASRSSVARRRPLIVYTARLPSFLGILCIPLLLLTELEATVPKLFQVCASLIEYVSEFELSATIN